MITEQQYIKIVPYKGICELFAKHGEYVGGADGLVSIYETEFSTKVQTSCPACVGAMLLDVHNKITEYENR